uniref:Uncharacterized protein n=1 Tax=Steinernema glaseri TaxID=37863 RepID=A0A1I8AAH5_9BILA
MFESNDVLTSTGLNRSYKESAYPVLFFSKSFISVRRFQCSTPQLTSCITPRFLSFRVSLYVAATVALRCTYKQLQGAPSGQAIEDPFNSPRHIVDNEVGESKGTKSTGLSRGLIPGPLAP